MHTDKPKPGHLGHRQRIKERYLENGIGDLTDKDLLELVLTYAIPRRDVYGAAEKLINEFGSFDGVLSASGDAIKNTVKLSDHTLILLRLIGDIIRREKTGLNYRRDRLTRCVRL